jgi:NTP pyrophosphatase (non-canonical NTP hydrolase)
MNSFEELSKSVVQWANDRKIIPNSKPSMQLLKSVSEMGELCDAYAKMDRIAVIDGIGDVMVTLIIFAALTKLDPVDCLEHAYEQIKDRRGTLTEDGIFIKESDA